MSRDFSSIVKGSRAAHHNVLSTYAHDFETTLHANYSSEVLRGILNIGALLHEVIYICDSAIGDNIHILRSFWDAPEEGLHFTVKEFIKSGILRCLFRDKVAVKDRVLFDKRPTLGQIYEGWCQSGAVIGPAAKSVDMFRTTMHGPERSWYNEKMDRLLFHDAPSSAVEWYNPDLLKQEYRERIRNLVNSQSTIRALINGLPPEVMKKFLLICEKEPYFTNVNLWALVDNLNIESAKNLALALGHINQQCYADCVSSGMIGSDYSSISLDKFNWAINAGSGYEISIDFSKTKSLDEVFERANVTLSAPSIELLGLLTPEQILELREKANATIFKLAHEGPSKQVIDTFQREYIMAMRDYWQHICDFLEKKYPSQTLRKNRLGIFIHKNIPEIAPALKASVISLVVNTSLNAFWGDTFVDDLLSLPVSVALNQALDKLGIVLLYEQTPQMKEVIDVKLWIPKKVWATNKWK